VTRAIRPTFGIALVACAALACGGAGPLDPSGAAGATAAAGHVGAAGNGGAGHAAPPGDAGADVDTLTCAWLASHNCWKAAIDDAVGCLPSESDTGTLSADDETCTYASGITVTFASPLVLPPPQDPTWNFTVMKNGVDCLHYEDSPAGFTLIVKGKTVRESVVGFGLEISCPDGTTVDNANPIELLSCPSDGGFGGVPGDSWSSGGTNLDFGLLGATSGMQSIFDCLR
jgi:hypothetical protein